MTWAMDPGLLTRLVVELRSRFGGVTPRVQTNQVRPKGLNVQDF